MIWGEAMERTKKKNSKQQEQIASREHTNAAVAVDGGATLNFKLIYILFYVRSCNKIKRVLKDIVMLRMSSFWAVKSLRHLWLRSVCCCSTLCTSRCFACLFISMTIKSKQTQHAAERAQVPLAGSNNSLHTEAGMFCVCLFFSPFLPCFLCIIITKYRTAWGEERPELEFTDSLRFFCFSPKSWTPRRRKEDAKWLFVLLFILLLTRLFCVLTVNWFRPRIISCRILSTSPLKCLGSFLCARANPAMLWAKWREEKISPCLW